MMEIPGTMIPGNFSSFWKFFLVVLQLNPMQNRSNPDSGRKIRYVSFCKIKNNFGEDGINYDRKEDDIQKGRKKLKSELYSNSK